MHVTIRYSGTLGDLASLPDMVEEFQDIAATHAWPTDLVEGVYDSIARGPAGLAPRLGAGLKTLSPPLALKGLKLIVHPQTDPLWLTFDGDGQLTRLGYFSVDGPAGPAGRRFELIHQPQASIQTSIGGVLLHKTVVGLLDRLKRAYVPDLQVSDDSGYFDSRDGAHLQRLMGS
jgi:hypothetical protein